MNICILNKSSVCMSHTLLKKCVFQRDRRRREHLMLLITLTKRMFILLQEIAVNKKC